MRRWTTDIVLTLAVICVLAYVADWIVLQLRERGGSAHGVVMVNSTEAIKEKGSKVEYFFSPPQPTPCVRSLFPHEDQSACWWLARHSDKQTFMN